MNICIECGKEYEAKRATSKYCSAACRKVAFQNRQDGVPENDKSGSVPSTLPANFGQPDCQCKHCQQNRANGNKHIINHGPYKTADELAPNEVNRMSLPGDVDYVPEPRPMSGIGKQYDVIQDSKASTATTREVGFEPVEGQTVYHRPAVRYDLSEAWDFRPEPDSPNDKPKLHNRGRYIRPDGSHYQIDAVGISHNVGALPARTRRKGGLQRR